MGLLKKYKINRKTRTWSFCFYLVPMVALLIATMAYLLVKGIFWKGVTRAERGVLGAEAGYIDMDRMDKNF